MREFLIQSKGQAFGGTTGFEKLIQFDGVGGVAPVLEHRHGFGAAGGEHDMGADTHRIAGESFSFILWHNQSAVFFDPMGDGSLRIRV